MYTFLIALIIGYLRRFTAGLPQETSVLDDIATISSFKHQHVALALLHDCLSFGPAVYSARLVEPSPEVLRVYEELDAVVLSALDSITGCDLP